MLRTPWRVSRRTASCALSVWFLLAGLASPSPGITRHAVLVGIDTYNPCGESHPNLSQLAPTRSHCSDWVNLEGSVNDALGMESVIELRYGFQPANVHVLINQQATRQAILGAIQRYLFEKAEPDDVVFFYYAGHGSQVRNSLSYERDKMDQTIVPVDANRGVRDIRDKTLARLFNKMLDKHLIVTAIFDSCHSGAMARGLAVPARGRDLPAIDNRDARDPFRGPFPEDRGALILSAAQADEIAEETDTAPVHGRFTDALLRVLRTAPVNAPVIDIYKMVEAQVEANDPGQLLGYGIENQQIPNWEGKSRGERPLFGVESKQGAKVLTVAALQPAGDVVPLRAGTAIGLAPGSELRRVGQTDSAAEVRLQVTDASVAQAAAKVIKGDIANVHAGDLFEVVKWAEMPGSPLTVWVPSSPPSRAEILRTAVSQKKNSGAEGLAWVDDPTRPDVCAPTEMFWEANQWKVYRPDRPCLAEGTEPPPAATGSTPRRVAHDQFFLALPPTPELARRLAFGKNLRITQLRAAADYLLVGRWHDGKLEYAWVHPGSVSNASSALPLPPRSDWVALGDDSPKAVEAAAHDLVLRAQRLARIYGWLTLSSPPQPPGLKADFPYHLELKRAGCGRRCQEYRRSGDTVQEGQEYGLVLRANPADVRFSTKHDRRWVYVFVVDSWGCSQLLVPEGALGNEEKTNLEPPQQGFSWPSEVTLLGPDRAFTIGPPFGTDTYVLLTTREPIADLSVFQFAGARTRSAGRSGQPASQLEQLLQATNSSTRGAAQPYSVPQDWSIERMLVRSIPRPGISHQDFAPCDAGP